eukprot:SAG22_NODE_1408_length_4484_cov_9.346180_2_plen_197_part_00
MQGKLTGPGGPGRGARQLFTGGDGVGAGLGAGLGARGGLGGGTPTRYEGTLFGGRWVERGTGPAPGRLRPRGWLSWWRAAAAAGLPAVARPPLSEMAERPAIRQPPIALPSAGRAFGGQVYGLSPRRLRAIAGILGKRTKADGKLTFLVWWVDEAAADAEWISRDTPVATEPTAPRAIHECLMRCKLIERLVCFSS